jgi:hypothetical protein
MKLLMTSKYKVLNQTKNYPLAGYWYSIAEVINTPFNDTYKDFYNGNTNRNLWLNRFLIPTSEYYPSVSELRHARVLINENTCKISITLPKVLQDKKVAMILLYAIDGLVHLNYDYSDNGEVSSAEYALNINNLSMVVCNPIDGEFINRSTNIIDLKHRPTCSLVTNISDATIGVHDSHYLGSLLDRDLLSSIRLNYYTDKFIESWSGTEAARDRQGTGAPNKLYGSMTMNTDRLVEL